MSRGFINEHGSKGWAVSIHTYGNGQTNVVLQIDSVYAEWGEDQHKYLSPLVDALVDARTTMRKEAQSVQRSFPQQG